MRSRLGFPKLWRNFSALLSAEARGSGERRSKRGFGVYGPRTAFEERGEGLYFGMRLVLGKRLRMKEKLTAEDRAALRTEFERLRQEHRDLDAAIEALLQLGTGDRLQIQRLKKRKLVLRDRLAFLEDQLTPDIIA